MKQKYFAMTSKLLGKQNSKCGVRVWKNETGLVKHGCSQGLILTQREDSIKVEKCRVWLTLHTLKPQVRAENSQKLGRGDS